MAEVSRVLIGLVCGLFILSAIPYTTAQEDVNLDSLVLEFDNQFEQWYEIGEVLDIKPILTNFGDQISISNDPSCETYVIIKDINLNTIYDNSANCRDQDQQIIIQPMEIINFQNWQWDFTDLNGDVVPSGPYNVDLIHSKTNLRVSHLVYFQQNIAFDSNLELKLDVASLGSSQNRDGHHLIGITLSNPTNSEIVLPTQESCKLIYSLNGQEKMLNSCYGGNLKLHAYENSYLDGVFIQRGELVEGDNMVIVKTPGGDLVKELIIENDNPTISNYEELDEKILVTTSENIGLETDHVSFLSYSLNLENNNDQPIELTFPDTCKFEMYIINDLSELIFDTTEQQSCQDFQTSHTIEASEILTFDLPEWYLENQNNCYVDSGIYTIILEIPQYSVTAVEQFDYSEVYRNPECSKENIGFESEYIIEEDQIISLIKISPSTPIVKIKEQCLIFISLTSFDETIEFEEFMFSSCNHKSGNYFNLPIGSDGEIVNLEFESNIMIPQMTDRDSIELKLTTEHTLGNEGFKTHIITHTYDFTNEVFKIQKWQLEGLWTNIGTGQNDCWMISNNEVSYLLVDSDELPSWSPQNNWKGDYLVSDSSSSSEICQTQFELLGIEVHSVYSEEKIIIEKEVVVFENEQVPSEKITPEDVAKVTIVVVSTTSMFAILSLFVINTESLRIPTTAAGLWLLGFIGKTQETTDGRFQRGRLMGYLTANPGCHFRALMAALGMSNGQITHHLRLLEQQEFIWRLRDGRLVRYYPLNNSLYPGMDPGELPIPPLSPDPNSLQGKILSLLDDEHQYGKFPTQAELAVKLEKSQQLISHHLRTLQKFGLVEKRKMGIKNRYKLTKEALFLLETDVDFKE